MIFRTCRYTNNFPRSDRQNTRVQTTRLDRRHNKKDERKHRKTRNGVERNNEKNVRSRLQTTSKKVRILYKGNKIGRTQNRQNRPKRDTTITGQTGSNHEGKQTKEQKRIEIFLGGHTTPIDVY